MWQKLVRSRSQVKMCINKSSISKSGYDNSDLELWYAVPGSHISAQWAYYWWRYCCSKFGAFWRILRGIWTNVHVACSKWWEKKNITRWWSIYRYQITISIRFNNNHKLWCRYWTELNSMMHGQNREPKQPYITAFLLVQWSCTLLVLPTKPRDMVICVSWPFAFQTLDIMK